MGCEEKKSDNSGISGPDILDNLQNYNYLLLLTYTIEGYNLIFGPNDETEINSIEIIMDNEIIELNNIGDAYYHTFSTPLIGGHNYHFNITINEENYPSFNLKMVHIFTNMGVLDNSKEKPKIYWELDNNNLAQRVGGTYYNNSQQNNYEIFLEPSQRSYRFPSKDQWSYLFVDELNYSEIEDIACLSLTGFNVTIFNNNTYKMQINTKNYYFDLLRNNVNLLELLIKNKQGD